MTAKLMNDTLRSIAFQFDCISFESMSQAEKNIAKILIIHDYGEWSNEDDGYKIFLSYGSTPAAEEFVEEVE